MCMFADLFSVLVITIAAAQSCPANQIASDAQILLYSTVADRISAANFDTNLTYITDVLGYSDDEIQREIQNAHQFFSERFGLEFSPMNWACVYSKMPPYNQLGGVIQLI